MRLALLQGGLGGIRSAREEQETTRRIEPTRSSLRLDFASSSSVAVHESASLRITDVPLSAPLPLSSFTFAWIDLFVKKQSDTETNQTGTRQKRPLPSVSIFSVFFLPTATSSPSHTQPRECFLSPLHLHQLFRLASIHR